MTVSLCTSTTASPAHVHVEPGHLVAGSRSETRAPHRMACGRSTSHSNLRALAGHKFGMGGAEIEVIRDGPVRDKRRELASWVGDCRATVATVLRGIAAAMGPQEQLSSKIFGSSQVRVSQGGSVTTVAHCGQHGCRDGAHGTRARTRGTRARTRGTRARTGGIRASTGGFRARSRGTRARHPQNPRSHANLPRLYLSRTATLAGLPWVLWVPLWASSY